jgi:hypothetical protein
MDEHVHIFHGFIPGLQQKVAPCTTFNFLTNSVGEANGLILGCIEELFRNSWIVFGGVNSGNVRFLFYLKTIYHFKLLFKMGGNTNRIV